MRKTEERIAEGLWLIRVWWDPEHLKSESTVLEFDGRPSPRP